MKNVRITLLLIVLLVMIMPSFHGLLGRMIAGKGYRKGATDFVSLHNKRIAHWAQTHDIPSVALAAIVGDRKHNAMGSQSLIDWMQDELMLPAMPQWTLALDFDKGYDSPWFNLAKHAVGPANIPISDGIALLKSQPKQFTEGWEHVDIAKHLATADGTFQVIALQMVHIKKNHPELQTAALSEVEKELRYVSAYFSEELKVDLAQTQAETERLRNFRANLYAAMYE